MKQLFQRFTSLFSSSRRTVKAQRGFRPTFERLEERDVMSTLFIVPAGQATNATHFHDFQSAYQAASNGDLIQVQPNAKVASVGAGVIGNRLSGGGINTNSITIDNTKIKAGEWVNIDGGGNGFEDTMLVLSAQSNAPGQVTLTFTQNLGSDHTGAGATVTTTGELGIVKQITLQGNTSYGQATVSSPIEIPSGVAHVTFNNLNFTSANGLTVDFDHQFIEVEHSTLKFLALGIGPGNANDIITHNHFTGAVVDNGDGNYLSADQVTNNSFTGSGSLYMINNGCGLIANNTFSVTTQGAMAAAVVYNCDNVYIYGNQFNLQNPNADSTCMFLGESQYFPQAMAATVVNNGFHTGGKGTGLDIEGTVSVMVQGNDFRNNAVGVWLYGDGNTVGTVDLGGGPLGSSGGNNFSSFTLAGAATGHFAIAMHNTSAGDTVDALNDIWGVAMFSRPQLVKDAYVHAASSEAVYTNNPVGSGTIVTFKLLIVSPVTGSNLHAI